MDKDAVDAKMKFESQAKDNADMKEANDRMTQALEQNTKSLEEKMKDLELTKEELERTKVVSCFLLPLCFIPESSFSSFPTSSIISLFFISYFPFFLLKSPPGFDFSVGTCHLGWCCFPFKKFHGIIIMCPFMCSVSCLSLSVFLVFGNELLSPFLVISSLVLFHQCPPLSEFKVFCFRFLGCSGSK